MGSKLEVAYGIWVGTESDLDMYNGHYFVSFHQK